jgi:peptide/nickel transport system permease protein/oligopeptide transport system permease protein
MNNLLVFTIKRFLAMILVVWVIVTLVFFMVHLSPIDPVAMIMGTKVHTGEAQKLRHDYGLDKPLMQQYVDYWVNLAHGNFGYSMQQQRAGQPVWPILSVGVPVSLKLGGLALLLALIIGLPSGLISALRQNAPVADHANQTVMMILWSVPVFVIAPICQEIFAVKLHWLPVANWGDPGIQGIKEMIMPVVIFGAQIAGFFSKSFRSFMLEVLNQDYIRTARSKGLKERVVIYLHAIKNTLLPLATIVGPTIAFLVTGAFIIEAIFNIPGIGNITVQAALTSDYSVVQATTLLVASAVVFVNFLTDVFYAMVDPRVRL